MVPYEYLLSESQEMLFVAHKGREQDNRYFPPRLRSCGRDGYFRTSGADSVQGEVAAQTQLRLWLRIPLYHRQLLTEPPEYKAWEWTSDCLPPCTSAGIETTGSTLGMIFY